MWKTLLAGLISLAAVQCLGINYGAGKSEWWENCVVYQVYPRSFKDTNNDGVGDLNGIISKLRHFREAGAAAIWLSPIYTSPQVDFGYDISSFTDIDPTFGTIQDFRKLVTRAKTLGLKVLLDLVPNHSSDQHEWFKKSVERVKPYDEYYIWHDGKKAADGTRLPPNNWLSGFGGPAWQWNEQRKQYYYHMFAVAQPDLNYRSTKLRQEMENVIKFWLDLGVDGFRVDAVIHLMEDEQLRDEPLSNIPGASPDEHQYLDHIYTKNLDENYEVVGSWRKMLDDYAETHKTNKKFAIVEAANPPEKLMKYYEIDMDPFNFMFTLDLNNKSKPSDFEREILGWMTNMPKGKIPNWVIGNHDISRVASRFGSQRADQISMLTAVLPGITIIYNGDEIGMVNRPLTWGQTVDPAGCNAGKNGFQQKSRDPARTPFQWDDTVNAGFSKADKTWLPVNDNYKYLNLAAQKKAPNSHFKVFRAVANLKKTVLLRTGQLEVSHNQDQVLGVVRRLPHVTPLALLINFEESNITLDLRPWLHVPDHMKIYVASVGSGLEAGNYINTTEFSLPAAASVILVGDDLDRSMQKLLDYEARFLFNDYFMDSIMENNELDSLDDLLE